jgi:hypothetical protein
MCGSTLSPSLGSGVGFDKGLDVKVRSLCGKDDTEGHGKGDIHGKDDTKGHGKGHGADDTKGQGQGHGKDNGKCPKEQDDQEMEQHTAHAKPIAAVVELVWGRSMQARGWVWPTA